MKKILLSALALSAMLQMSAQDQPLYKDHIATKAVYDDFADADEFVDGVDEYSAEDVNNFGWDETENAPSDENAYKGMFWTEAAGTINGFYATKERDAANNQLNYSITQTQGNYEPFLMVFGSYSDGGTKADYTIDLTENAVVSFDITNNDEDTDIRFTVQLQDVHGASLVYLEDVEGDEEFFYNYNIGYSQGESQGLYKYIRPGTTENFSFDFATAIEGCLGDVVATASTTDDCDEDFDYSKVKAITFTVVDNESTGNVSGTHGGPEDYLPLAIEDLSITISEFKMGDQDVIGLFNAKEEASFSAFPNPSTNGTTTLSKEVTNVSVIDALGNVVLSEASATTLNTSSLEAGVYLVKSDQGTVRLIVK